MLLRTSIISCMHSCRLPSCLTHVFASGAGALLLKPRVFKRRHYFREKKKGRSEYVHACFCLCVCDAMSKEPGVRHVCDDGCVMDDVLFLCMYVFWCASSAFCVRICTHLFACSRSLVSVCACVRTCACPLHTHTSTWSLCVHNACTTKHDESCDDV